MNVFHFKASKNGGDLNDVDVVDVLIEMRQHRMGLIQTADQLRFSYIAILEGAKRLFQDNSSVQVCYGFKSFLMVYVFLSTVICLLSGIPNNKLT